MGDSTAFPAVASQPNADAHPALEVTNLASGYGDLRAVWDVSLTVDRGGVTVVLGLNGAGKTTTLLAISGLLPTSEGNVRFQGHDLGASSVQSRVRQGIAFVPEGKRVFHGLSVKENLLIGGILLNKRERLEALDRVLEIFPVLRERANSGADGLSGGQQQMLAIGASLMTHPKVLLLDEPSAGLAPKVMGSVIEVLERLTDEGVSILLVEQVVEVALPIANRVVLLSQGRDVYSVKDADPAETQNVVERYLRGHALPDSRG